MDLKHKTIFENTLICFLLKAFDALIKHWYFSSLVNLISTMGDRPSPILPVPSADPVGQPSHVLMHWCAGRSWSFQHFSHIHLTLEGVSHLCHPCPSICLLNHWLTVHTVLKGRRLHCILKGLGRRGWCWFPYRSQCLLREDATHRPHISHTLRKLWQKLKALPVHSP